MFRKRLLKITENVELPRIPTVLATLILTHYTSVRISRVSYGGEGLEFPPPHTPSPEILKLSMVIIVVPSILAI